MSQTIELTLKIWRQERPDGGGAFETYTVKDVSTELSFLEMLDVLNTQLI